MEENKKAKQHAIQEARQFMNEDNPSMNLIKNRWFRKQLFFIASICVVFFLIHITLDYAYDERVLKIERNKDTIKDLRYKLLDGQSQIVSKTRYSKVQEYLKNISENAVKLNNDTIYILE